MSDTGTTFDLIDGLQYLNGSGEHPLRMLGRAVYVRTLPRKAGRPKEEIGVEFVDLADEDRAALLEFIGRQLA